MNGNGSPRRSCQRGLVSLRRVAEVLPLLYLHGLSSSDFGPALEQFLGSAAGLSAATITRLTAQWQDDAAAFTKRSLKDTDYVYVWVDGIHLKVRLEQDKVCLLVMIGVRADGTKELVALADGFRESSESWADLLRSCRRRGMTARCSRSATGRWGSGRPAGGVPRHPRAAVLVPRQLQRPCRPAEVGAPRREGRAGRDLQRRGQGPRTQAVKAFETDYGAKWPKATPRSPSTLTCCWRSTTTPPSIGYTCAPTNPIESDLRHRATTATSHPKGPGSKSSRCHGHGVQAHRVGTGALARRSTPPTSSRWSVPEQPVREGETRRTTNQPRRSRR